MCWCESVAYELVWVVCETVFCQMLFQSFEVCDGEVTSSSEDQWKGETKVMDR